MAKALNVSLAVTADTSQAKAELQALQRNLQQLASSSNNIQLGINSQSIQDASKAALELSAHLKAATNANTGLLNFSQFESSIRRSGQSIEQYGAKLMQLGPKGQQAFTQMTQAIVKSEIPMKKMSGLLGQFGTVISNTIRWQLSSSLIHGFMGSIQKAYGYAQDLNQSLNNIQIVTQMSDTQMSKFAESANKAAKSLSTTTTSYTDAALIYYQQGIRDQNEINERTSATIKMANVTGQSAEKVSNQMTAIWNNFAKGGDNLEYYADVITALGAATASSSEEISRGLEKFAATADTVGLSYENATAALATITATTRQSADTVGTGLRTLFARLDNLKLGETLEDGVDLTKYTKALQSVGVQVLDTNGNLKRMDDILDELGERWGDISDTQKVALAQTVGGVRQYTTLMALMNNFDFYKENIDIAKNSEGTLQKQQEIYEKSWAASSKRVRAAMETIYSTLINDQFFINFNDGFAQVLNTINQIIQGLGGMKGLLASLGSLGLNIFAPQMTQGLYNAFTGISDIFHQKSAGKLGERRSEVISNLAGMMSGGYYDTATGRMENVNISQSQAYQNLIMSQQAYYKNSQFMAPWMQSYGQMLLDNEQSRIQQLDVANTELQAATRQRYQAQGAVYGLSSGWRQQQTAERSQEAISREMGALISEGYSNTSLVQDYTRQRQKEFSIETSKEVMSALGKYVEDRSAYMAENTALEKFYQLPDDIQQAIIEGRTIEDKLNQDQLDEWKKSLGTGLTEYLQSGNYSNLGDILAARMEQHGLNAEAMLSKYDIDINSSAFKDWQKGIDNETSKKMQQQLLEKGLIKPEDFEKLKDPFMVAASNTQNIARGLSSALAVATSLQAVMKAIGDESLSTSDKITQVVSGLAQTGIQVTMAANALSKISIGGAAIGMGPALGIVAAITTLMIALPHIINVFDNMHTSSDERLTNLKANTEQAEQAALSAKQAYNDLMNGFSGHSSLVEGLKELTKGTLEYEAALIKANDAAYQLINDNNLTSEDFYTDENGIVQIRSEAQERLQQEAINKMQRTQGEALAAKALEENTKVSIANAEVQKAYQKILEQSGITGTQDNINTLNDYIQSLIDEGYNPEGVQVNQAKEDLQILQQHLKNLYSSFNYSDYENILSPLASKYNITNQELFDQMRSGSFQQEQFIRSGAASRNQLLAENILKSQFNTQDLDQTSKFLAETISTNGAFWDNISKQAQKITVAREHWNEYGITWTQNDEIDLSADNITQSDASDAYIAAMKQSLGMSDEDAAAAYQELIKSDDYLKSTNKAKFIANATMAALEYGFSAEELKNVNEIIDNTPGLRTGINNFTTSSISEIGALYAENFGKDEKLNAVLNQMITTFQKSATNFGQAAFEGISTDIDGAQLKNKVSELISVLSPEDFTSLLNLKSNLVSIMGEAGNDKFAEILLKMEGANGELKDFYESLDFSKGANNVLKQIKSSKGFKEESGNLAYEQFLQIRDAIGGDSGIFQNLYNSILTDETLMKKLSDTFKSTGSITAETIYELADSSQAVADALEVGTFNAEGLASALEAINDEGLNINAESVSNVFLKVMSTAGAVKNQMAEVFEYIDNYQKTRSAADIGAFYQGLVKDVNTSISQGLFGDDLFKQSFGTLFGDSGLAALNDFLDRTSGLTEKEKQNAWKKDEAMTPYRKAMAEVEKTGHMGGMYGYYLNDQGMTGENVVNGVYTDAQGNTITRGKNGIYSINGTEAFGYTKKGGFAVYDESFYDQFQTQEDFTRYLQDAFGMNEVQAKSMSSDLASHGQGINKKWTQGSVRKALDDFEAELGEEGSGLLSADELAAFEKKYGDYLKEGSEERARFDELKANSFGVGKDFNFSKNTQGQEAWDNLNTAMQENGALGLQEYLDRSLDGSKNINDLVSSFERLGYSAEEAGQFISSNADHFEDFTYKMRDANGEVNNFNLDDLAKHFDEGPDGRSWDQILSEDFGGNILKAFQQMQQDLQSEFEQTTLGDTISEAIQSAFGEDGIKIEFNGDQASLDAILDQIPDEIPIKIVYTDENGNSVTLDGAGNPVGPSPHSSSSRGAPAHAPGSATPLTHPSSSTSETPAASSQSTVQIPSEISPPENAAEIVRSTVPGTLEIPSEVTDPSNIATIAANAAILAGGNPVGIPTYFLPPSNSLPTGEAAGMNNVPGFAGGYHLNNDFQGIAETGELGPELWIHDGQPALTGVHGRNKIFVSKDDQIFTASQTREILRKNPDLQNIPGFVGDKNPDTKVLDRAYGGDSGGSGGSGNGDKKENEYKPERYHVISRQLAVLQRQYERLEKAKENAYGTNILDAIDDEIAAQDKLIKKQRDYIKEIESYRKKDLKELDKLGVKYKLDENGNISNWEALQKKYEKKAQNGDEKAKKIWEAIQQYEETIDKLEEEKDKLQDQIREKAKLQLEKITTQAELKIKFDDKQLTLIQHQIDKLDDDIYSSAEVLALVGDNLDRINDKIATSRTAINNIFKDMKDKNGNAIKITMEQFLAMSAAQRDALDINGDFGLALEEQLENILDYIEELEEFKTKGVEELSEAFSELSENVDDAIGNFSYYTGILTTMRDIIDLQNIKFPKALRESVNDVQQALMNTSKNNIKAYQDYYMTLEEQANNLRSYIETVTDTQLKKQYQEQLDQLENAMDECMSEVADLWQATLSQAQEDFERNLDWIIEDYATAISGIYGDLDTLSGAYERTQKANERYAEDYEKFYQLSKLQRTINKDLDKAALNGYKHNKNMRDLLEEIEQLQSSGADLSAYDLELLQKRYEYYKALADLEDARDAKSQVRLQRDRNGNWGYVYTANEENIENMQQAADDKLYELQKFIRESSNDLEQQILDLQQTYAEERAELIRNGAAPEVLQEFDDYYNDQLSYLQGEYQKTLDDAGKTVDAANKRYNKDNFDIVDQFKETAMASISAATSTSELINNVKDAMGNAAKAMTAILADYQSVIDGLNELVAGDGDFATNIRGFIASVDRAQEINLGITQEAISDFGNTYDEVLTAAEAFDEKFRQIYEPIIKRNEEFVQALTDALETMNRLQINNNNGNKASGQNNANINKVGGLPTFDTGGYTGDWGSNEGKLAILHQKEQIFNQEDTARILVASKILQTIDLQAKSASGMFSNIFSPKVKDNNQVIEQSVHIEASFPNAVNHTEIEEAFNNLSNKAIQYANRKNK